MGTQIIDAFIVTFGIQAEGFAKGEREIEVATRRLREDNKKTFDQMEQRGKSAAQTFKGVRNEVVGLGLAFMGAQSIAGFIGNMMTGAASAHRMGKTMGMATEKIWSWRMAMKGVGGQVGEADAALQAIQKAKMGWTLSGDTGNNLAFSRLDVNAKDLQSSDPGTILKKIAGMQGKMDPQLYASLLQQIGMPSAMVYFLQEGKDSVDKLLAEYEKNSGEQEKLAKETEELQKSMATLQATIMNELVPPLVTIAQALNLIVPYLAKDPLYAATGGRNAWDYIGGAIGGKTGKWITENMGASGSGGGGAPFQGATSALLGGLGFNMSGGGGTSGAAPASGDDNIMRYFMSKGLSHDQALGIRAAIHAEGGDKKPFGGGYKGRAIGIGQLLGSRRAEFLKRYGKNFTRQNELDFMWWELNGGDPGGGGAHVLKETSSAGVLNAMINKFYRPAKGRETLGDLSRGTAYLRSHRHGGTTINITNNNNIRATDPKGTAREIDGLSRRSAVSQADRGVAP